MSYYKINLNDNIIFNKAGKFQTISGFKHQTQKNKDFEIIVNLKNDLFFAVDGKRHTISANEFIVIPPNTEFYAYDTTENICSFYWCHFSADAFDTIESMEISSDTSRVGISDVYLPSYLNPMHIQGIIVLLNQLLDSNNMPTYSSLYDDYLLKVLLLELTQQLIISISASQTDSKKIVKQIIKWLKMNVRSHITMDDVASQFMYNKTYLGRIFKKETNMTILQYLNYYKIKDSKYLLLNTNMSIKEIASALNFSNHNYFMRVFKKSENMSPTEFRNTYKNTNYNTTY